MSPTEGVLFTGAGSGLGAKAAAQLLRSRPDLHLVVGSTDPGRTRHALLATSGTDAAARLTVLELDLASIESTERFAAEALGRAGVPPITTVVANAGIQLPDTSRVTVDSYERTFGVNVLGHHVLLRALGAPTTPYRVVLTASGTHHDLFRYRLGFPGPRWRDPLELATPANAASQRRAGMIAYSTSKLAVVYLGYELARRSPDSSVTVHDPGLVPGTGLADHLPPPGRFVFTKVAPALRVLPTVTSPDAAGSNLAALVTPTGAPYVALSRAVRSSRESYNEERASLLWERLEQLRTAASSRT